MNCDGAAQQSLSHLLLHEHVFLKPLDAAIPCVGVLVYARFHALSLLDCNVPFFELVHALIEAKLRHIGEALLVVPDQGILHQIQWNENSRK